jgi:hypothetical protein
MALNKDAKRGWTRLDQEGCSTGEVDFVTGISLASGDVTLTTAQSKAVTLEVATGHASNSIVIAAVDAVPGKLYIVVNLDSSLAANIKVASGAAVALAASKTAIVRTKSDGTQVLRVTADS